MNDERRTRVVATAIDIQEVMRKLASIAEAIGKLENEENLAVCNAATGNLEKTRRMEGMVNAEHALGMARQIVADAAGTLSAATEWLNDSLAPIPVGGRQA